MIILQYHDSRRPGERSESVADDRQGRLIEFRQNADHQIGAIDLFDLFLRLLAGWVRLPLFRSSNPGSSRAKMRYLRPQLSHADSLK